MKKPIVNTMITLVISALIAVMANVAAAEVIRVDKEDGTFNIAVTEAIEKGDADELKSLIGLKNFSGWVHTASRGGSVREGWAMAKIIRDAGAKTYVNESYTCMSACTYVFMGGVERYIEETAEYNLGYHPAYISKFDGDTSFNQAYKWGQQDALDTAYRFSYFVPEGYEFQLIKFLTVAYDNSDKENFYYAETADLVKAGIVTHTF